MHVELPSGNTVDVVEKVTNGQRKRYYEAIENAREVEADVPIVKYGPDNKPLRDADGNIEIERDENNRPITERKNVVPVAASMDTLDVFMGMLITAWTFDLPLPSTGPQNGDGSPRDVLDELDIGDYDTLSKAVEPLIEKLRPSFKPDPDPQSPTGPSSE